VIYFLRISLLSNPNMQHADVLLHPHVFRGTDRNEGAMSMDVPTALQLDVTDDLKISKECRYINYSGSTKLDLLPFHLVSTWW
jgi:hypothetical protein